LVMGADGAGDGALDFVQAGEPGDGAWHGRASREGKWLLARSLEGLSGEGNGCANAHLSEKLLHVIDHGNADFVMGPGAI
jgi:hypothetical protein